MAPQSALDGIVVCFYNYGTGTVIDLNGGSPADGTNVTGFGYNGGQNQMWKLVQVGTDGIWPVWKLLNQQSGTYLDLTNDSGADYTNIQGKHGYPDDIATKSQLWRLFTGDLTGSIVGIQNFGTGTWIDLKNGSNADLTQLIGHSGDIAAENPHQLWKMVRQ